MRSADLGNSRPVRGLRVALLTLAGILALAACGEGPAAPNYGYTAPGDVLEDSQAFEDNPKDSAAALAVDPRRLARDIGCSAYSPVFADRVGELLGTCRLQGRQLKVVSFADQNAQQAYLQTHRNQGVYIVDDLWAVEAPTAALAQQVQQRVGGRLV